MKKTKWDASPLDNRVAGLCEWRKRKITIDLDKHTSDRQLRGTVLHEMAHAASEAHTHGHDVHFFAQVERLLRAPISVSVGEGGKGDVLANLVPARFPLLKRRMDRIEAHRAKQINDMIKAKNLSSYDVTEREIVQRFGDADGRAQFPWLVAVRTVGLEFALTDEVGRPLTAFARRVIAKGRKIHTRARREYLEFERISKMSPEERFKVMANAEVKLARSASA